MRKFLLSIMLMVVLFPLTMKAQEIVVGEATGTSNFGPFVNSYPYSWIEMIYKADEIGQAYNIGSIAFNYASGPTLETDEINIYLAETTKSVFEDKSQWTPESELVLVYSGTGVVIGDDAWETFEFDTPFPYSGEKNLAVVVSKKASGLTMSHWELHWACYNDANTLLFTANDYDESYAQYPTADGLATYGKKPVMKLIDAGGDVEPTLPAAPTNLGAIVEENVEGYDYKFRVTLTWDAVEGAEYYNVYVNTASATDHYMGFSTGTSYIVGVDQETIFEFYLETVIGENASEPSEPYTVIVKSNDVAELASSFNIYPNPVKDLLFVEAESGVEEVAVYNLAGVMVYSQQSMLNDQQSLAINVSDLNSGVYFVKIRTNRDEVVKRVVKL